MDTTSFLLSLSQPALLHYRTSASLLSCTTARTAQVKGSGGSGAVPGGRTRWGVGACRAWLVRNRGLLIRWSKKDANHLALLQLASGLIAFKKAHTARLASLPG